MNKEDCVIANDGIPDFVITLWWVFITIALVAGIFIIVGAFLNLVFEHFQDRRRAYLVNKQRELEIEALEKQEKEVANVCNKYMWEVTTTEEKKDVQ